MNCPKHGNQSECARCSLCCFEEKYTVKKLTEYEKLLIRGAKYQFVLKDPYPEIAEWSARAQAWLDSSSIFGKFFNRPEPMPVISPHKAWQDGFEFAWQLIEKKLSEL